MKQLKKPPGGNVLELRRIDKKGRITIPRSVLRAAGLVEDTHVQIKATSDGAVVMRQVAVYPIEVYSDERVREFEEANAIPPAMQRRLNAHVKGKSEAVPTASNAAAKRFIGSDKRPGVVARNSKRLLRDRHRGD